MTETVRRRPIRRRSTDVVVVVVVVVVGVAVAVVAVAVADGGYLGASSGWPGVRAC